MTKPDEQVRIMAARLRITTDSKLGKITPQWVLDLSAKPLYEDVGGADD